MGLDLNDSHITHMNDHDWICSFVYLEFFIKQKHTWEAEPLPWSQQQYQEGCLCSGLERTDSVKSQRTANLIAQMTQQSSVITYSEGKRENKTQMEWKNSYSYNRHWPQTVFNRIFVVVCLDKKHLECSSGVIDKIISNTLKKMICLIFLSYNSLVNRVE